MGCCGEWYLNGSLLLLVPYTILCISDEEREGERDWETGTEGKR